MPVPYQIIPEGSVFRPKIETHINDNSEVNLDYGYGGGTVTSGLFVFASPKGRDNEVITIRNGQEEFMKEYGLGPFSLYGQPLLNAYNAAVAATNSNAMLHCLRVMPNNAAYSTATLIAKYRVDATSHKMYIHFLVKGSDQNLTDLEDLDRCCTVDTAEDEDGYKAVKLWTVAYRGRGVYGQNVRFRLTSDTGSDKSNDYKNYNFEIYRKEDMLRLEESFSVCTSETAVLLASSETLYIDDIINNSRTGSSILRIVSFPAGYETLLNTYLAANPTSTFTLNDFDPLLGIDKYTREAIENLVIEPASSVTPGTGEVAVDLSSTLGIALMGGSDGDLAATVAPATRTAALNELYRMAFAAEIDPRIKSRFRYPTTFILDADFPVNVKFEIIKLVAARGDCMGMLDFGTAITTKASVMNYYKANFKGLVDDWHITFEPYCMKVVDPYSMKTLKVTSTYWLAQSYFRHIAKWNGKHRPLAGNTFGVLDYYVPDTVYPVYDESIDATLMDDLADAKLNIAKYNQRQVVVRSMQNTTQDKLTNLTEQNNALIVLDVKRDCELLVSTYEYDFSEAADIARFNTDIAKITNKYADKQVRRISGYFDKSQWEAERSILHLYIELVHKDLVKTVIIEIDVNRDTES